MNKKEENYLKLAKRKDDKIGQNDQTIAHLIVRIEKEQENENEKD